MFEEGSRAGVRTQLSLLLYLRTPGCGGHTKFLQDFEHAGGQLGLAPSSDQKDDPVDVATKRPRLDDSTLRAVEVAAAVGTMVIMDHALLHEGSEVREGCKDLLRTDVLFSGESERGKESDEE